MARNFLNIKNKSFFDNKKVILISRGTDKIFKVIDDLTNDDIQDVRVIISSSLLDKKSKLRNKFEKEKIWLYPFLHRRQFNIK